MEGFVEQNCLQAGCPFYSPSKSVKALNGTVYCPVCLTCTQKVTVHLVYCKKIKRKRDGNRKERKMKTALHVVMLRYLWYNCHIAKAAARLMLFSLSIEKVNWLRRQQVCLVFEFCVVHFLERLTDVFINCTYRTIGSSTRIGVLYIIFLHRHIQLHIDLLVFEKVCMNTRNLHAQPVPSRDFKYFQECWLSWLWNASSIIA